MPRPKSFRLTKEEKAIEDALCRGEYKPVSKAEFLRVKRAIAETRAKLKRGWRPTSPRPLEK